MAAQKLAEQRDRDSRRMLSIMETGLAMQAYQQGDLARARELLNRAAPARGRPVAGAEPGRLAAGVGERDGGQAMPRRGGDGGDHLPLPPGEDRSDGGRQTREDGLPSPSSQTGDGLGRPSSHEGASEDAYATGAAAPPRADDFRNFAWHWLNQSIDARYPELKSFDEHPGEVYEVAFSPDGTLLAAACHRRIVLRDPKTGKIRHDIAAHESDVNSIDFSPDGKLLASVGDDRRVRLWNVATGKLAADPGSHECEAVSVAFSSDGRRLATGDDRGLIIIWDVPNRRQEKRLIGHTGKVDSLDFAADGRLVSASGDWYMIAWNVDIAQPLWRVRAPHSQFIPLAISPDLKTIATGDHFGVPADLEPVGISRDGRTLLLDFTQFFDLESLGTLSLVGHETVPRCASFSPDGRTLAMGGMDGTVSLWDVGTARAICALEHRTEGEIGAIAFSPDGRRLAAAGRHPAGGSVTLWEIK